MQLKKSVQILQWNKIYKYFKFSTSLQNCTTTTTTTKIAEKPIKKHTVKKRTKSALDSINLSLNCYLEIACQKNIFSFCFSDIWKAASFQMPQKHLVKVHLDK